MNTRRTLLKALAITLPVAALTGCESLPKLGGGNADTSSDMFLATIPAQVEPWFVIATSIGAIVLCLLAALPPAWLAARVDPAVALRD